MFVKAFVSAWIAVWSAQVGYGSEEWRDLMVQGREFHAMGKYLDAIRVLGQAQTLADRSGADQRRMAEISESLGAAYADAGHIRNAEREYQRALAAIEKLEGAQSLDYAVVLATAADLRGETEIGEDVIARLRDALVKHGHKVGRHEGHTVDSALLAPPGPAHPPEASDCRSRERGLALRNQNWMRIAVVLCARANTSLRLLSTSTIPQALLPDVL